MIDDILPIILGAAAAGAGLVVLLFFVHHHGRKRAERLAPAFELGTSRRVGPLGTVVEGLYRGYSCRYTIQNASQYNPGGASLRLALTGPLRWTAELTDTGGRLMVKLGIFKDLQIGDHELDERLRFSATEDGSLRSLFGGESVRASMHSLVDSENFAKLDIREDRADAKWAPRNSRLDEDPEVLRARLETVTALLEACGYPPRIG